MKTLADLKGLKLRTAGAWLEMAKDLGAAPVTTAGGDVYPMLERGAIDATEWGTLWENIPPGFYKVAKYLIYPGVHQPTAPFELVINKDAWNKLSPADKQLVETVAKLVTFESWLKIGQEDAKALDFYKKAGNIIIELDPEVQYAARKIGLDWAEKTAKEGKYPWFAQRAQEPAGVRDAVEGRRGLAQGEGERLTRGGKRTGRGASAPFFRRADAGDEEGAGRGGRLHPDHRTHHRQRRHHGVVRHRAARARHLLRGGRALPLRRADHLGVRDRVHADRLALPARDGVHAGGR